MEIQIGDIEEGLAAEVRAQLRAARGQPVVFRIHSAGGSVLEGLSLYDAIAAYPGPTKAIIEGGALSMGSVVALAADETEITENSFVMAHSPSFEDDFEVDENELATLEKMHEKLLSIYDLRTALHREDLQAIMEREEFLDAETAVAYGFADRVIPTNERSRRAVDRISAAFPQYRQAVARARTKSEAEAKDIAAKFRAALVKASEAGVKPGVRAAWMEKNYPGLRSKYVEVANKR
jgi:ATP-dependent protease ClpP protease subunit